MANSIVRSNFVRFDSNGLELVVDTTTGKAYASISAAARMLDRNESTIRSAIASRKILVTDAQIQTEGGLQGSRLVDSETLYDMALDYNKALAKKMGSAGANVYMLGLAGYSIKVEEKPHTIPQTYAAALLEAGRLAMELEAASAKIEADKPLVEYAEAVQCSDDTIEIGEYAKLIGTGRNRLFQAMRDAGVIMKNSTLPYQQWIEAGYFEVNQEILENGKLVPFALITGKGQLWVKQRINQSAANQKQMIAAIVNGVSQMTLSID